MIKKVGRLPPEKPARTRGTNTRCKRCYCGSGIGKDEATSSRQSRLKFEQKRRNWAKRLEATRANSKKFLSSVRIRLASTDFVVRDDAPEDPRSWGWSLARSRCAVVDSTDGPLCMEEEKLLREGTKVGNSKSQNARDAKVGPVTVSGVLSCTNNWKEKPPLEIGSRSRKGALH